MYCVNSVFEHNSCEWLYSGYINFTEESTVDIFMYIVVISHAS